jgi:pyruvate/2-oxoglutarate dehydrogenase complex dihydrolipoamide acyltransferase (E2) component
MDVGRIGLKKHHIKGLLEIDVTDARRKIKGKRAGTGEKISFTSWLLFCIGRAVSEHRGAHALRKGRSGLVIFDDVDVSLVVEKEVDGVRVPLPMVLRRVNEKGMGEIFMEIESAKGKRIKDAGDYVLEKNRSGAPAGLFSLLPQCIRLLIWRALLSNPHRVKKMMGTVIVTSVGMMGKADGWFIPYSIHPLCFALGHTVKKPGIKKDKIGVREYLKMTVLIDHDVIDGAPALRFASRLVELMETAHGL